MNTLTLEVPGKLFIAGEYAVLEPGQKAVVIAVNRYVTANIKSSEQNLLFLPQMGLRGITWETGEEGVRFSISDSRLSFIENSINLASRFLQEKGIKLHPFKLEIKSELDDVSTGRKYGLGSSAAVVVAAVSAVLHLHSAVRPAPSLGEIFRLSSLAHLKTQGSGSGADIAAAVYGGWLEYSAFNSKWVLRELEQGDKLRPLIEKTWPDLSIRPITPPTELQLVVGWTGESALTGPLVKRVESFRENNLESYGSFLKESEEAVARLIKSFERNDCEEAINALAKNRRALKRLGEAADVPIETEELKTLCSIAEAFGSGKSSGAGGGDCGIALLEGDTKTLELYEAWEAAGISPLDLSVSKTGVSVILNPATPY